ncbi:hypothetical protein CkaCkLH20_06111 [Colletotrichum karsti]|uniref:Uncharacterized protein n=1 Tax=Colletotrichum karsti TaxID=1095194 RepID=A0A9P6I4E2_9PEZI|nr:uncharacterized protein CkaCkLH20_06111 [Colletotrichum karsti]KAF9876168.1 hypothetical protein CkaCkLH20_06111 [Colletotrichum karsti]
MLTRTGGFQQESGELKLDIDGPAWLCNKEVELTEFEAKRQVYLDLVLYGNIEEQRMDDLPARTPSVSLEELLLNIERGVVDRCILGRHTEGPLQRDYYRPRNLTSGGTFNMKNRENFNVERKLLLAILEIYQDLWNSCYSDTPASMDQNDTVNDAADFVKTYFNEGATFNWVANPLIDHYITRLGQDLADAAAKRVDPEQITQGELPIVSILSTSSLGGHLSQAYSNWMCLGFPPHRLAELGVTWDRIRKKEKCNEYRKTMASANIRQEFCFGIHTPGVVSVVLFKGDLPSTITDVDPSVLERIGWFPVSSIDESLGYWQYDYCSPYSLANKQAEKALFRVTMDSEVLGMYLPNGEWLAWEEEMGISTHRTGALV